MGDAHELVSELKRLAHELGRTPTRKDFEQNVVGARRKLERSFSGSYIILLKAAGFETPEERHSNRKIDNSVFHRDIEAHIENYQPAPYIPHVPYPTAAIISDIHWPFSCQRVIDAFHKYIEKFHPEWVIINGDAWDMYAHSKYPRSHNVFTPRDEQRLSREMNEKFWREIQKVSPNSKCVQLLGNHDLRPLKRILETYPEAEDWIAEKIKELFTFDGVKTIHDVREELFISDDIIVFHGYRSKLGDHRDYTLLNCINGHTHVGGAVFKQIRNGVLWELNCGVAGDPMSKGLSYTPQKIQHWTPGFAVLDEYGPRFIPA